MTVLREPPTTRRSIHDGAGRLASPNQGVIPNPSVKPQLDLISFQRSDTQHIDHHYFDRAFAGDQFQPQLFLHSSEKIAAVLLAAVSEETGS